MATSNNAFIVLRHVDGPRWCVVRRCLRDGKQVFAGRIATARTYEAARQTAIQAAKAERLVLGIETNRTRIRRFNPQLDMQEPCT